MHRHGYKGRKFRRETGQRKALMKSLAIGLFTHGAIETTLPKAKELRPLAEVLITKAKKGDLHSRRQVLSYLGNLDTVQRLVDTVAPQLAGRTSGYLRIIRTRLRVGDGTQMARISFVDTISDTAPATPGTKATKPTAKAKVVKPAKLVEQTA